ncbi:hypothetical protein BTE48_16505, partial [Oceanospirillum multiglobuliferum]
MPARPLRSAGLCVRGRGAYAVHECAGYKARQAMERGERACHFGDEKPGSTRSCDCAALHDHLRRAETEIHQLTRCIQLKDQKLCELRNALANSATAHYRVEDRLQRELDSLRIKLPPELIDTHFYQPEGSASGNGVTVRLPYLTSILSVLFDAMYVFWAD